MSPGLNSVSESALKFFGKMNTSISHEINNALAIINENAGLLEDVALMEERGVPLESKKIKKISEKIMEQVKRANRIIKNMNRLAHSVDESVKMVDIADTLEFMIVLSSRLSAIKGVSFKTVSRPDRLEISTNPFLAQNIIWFCLDYIMNLVERDTTISITVEEHGGTVQIRFSGINELVDIKNYAFPAEQETRLLETLNGELQIDRNNREIILLLFVHP